MGTTNQVEAGSGTLTNMVRSGMANGLPPVYPGVGTPTGLRIGKYLVEELLGEGGMGRVYRASDPDLGRTVALKVIRSEISVFSLSRLRDEAATMATLDHPNVLKVHSVETTDGVTYIVMEYAPGGSLNRRLNKEPQPPRRAAETVETLARAVEYAHGKGVVHRDLKPHNVLITEAGEFKIADFGLAKRLGQSQELSSTRAGVGSPAYMAPEQTRPDQPLSGAVDVYALGVILYECLTGRPPFHAANQEGTSDWVAFFEQIRWVDPTPPGRLVPKLHRDLEVICLKCLRKAPGARYASAGELADDLRRWLNGEPVQARPAPVWERAARYVRRRPWQSGLAAVLLAGGLAVAGLAVALREERREHEKQDEIARKDAAFRQTLQDQHRQSLKALNEIRKLVLEGELSRVGGLNPLNEKLQGYYNQLLDGDAADLAGSRAELAEAAEKLGELLARTGDKEKALAAYEKARERYEPEADDAARNAVARVRLERGRLFSDLGRYDEAEAEFARAKEGWAALLAAGTANRRPYLRQVAEVGHLRGELLNRLGQRDRALDEYRESLKARQQLADEAANPREQAADLKDVARSHGYMGDVFLDKGDLRQADRAFWASHQIRQRLADDLPRYAAEAAKSGGTPEAVADLQDQAERARFQFARSWGNFANLQTRTRAHRTAAHFADAAIKLQKELVAGRPNVTEYQTDLGDSLNRLADLRLAAGEPEAAREPPADALKVFQQLARFNPKDPSVRRGLAQAHLLAALAHADETDRQMRRKTRDHLIEAKPLLEELNRSARPNPRDVFLLAAARALEVEFPVSDRTAPGAAPVVDPLPALRQAVAAGYREKHPDDVADFRAFKALRDREEYREKFLAVIRQLRESLLPPA